ncbi:hypothetical protein D3C78_754750 [compost metagenome]
MLDGRVQGELVGVVEVLRLDRGGDSAFGLAQQVRHALVHRGQGSGFRQLAEGLDGLHALVEVQGRAWLEGTHRQVGGNVDTLVFVTGTQTIEDELQYLLAQAGGLDLGTELADCEVHRFVQVQVQLFLDQDAQYAQRCTTQGIGVLATGREHADTEDTHQGVELVGDGHSRAGQGRRQFGTGTARHVLLVQGQGNVLRLAVVERVVVAGNTLHFRELADHFGGQVAFRQQPGTRRTLGVAANALSDEGSQLGNPLGLVEDTAQLGLEHYVLQALVEAFQRLLLVLLEEEFGVGQAWAHDLLVAFDDLLRIATLDVGHGDEARQQLAVGIQQAEVFLVVLHGGDQGFLRYFKEAFLERAHQRHWPFDQGGHFIEQRWRHDGAAFLLHCQFGGTLADQLAALGKICQDVRLAQVFLVVGRGADAHVFRMVEAVATGFTTGSLRQQGAVDHFVTEQHDQPLGWTHELFLACTPAHALGDRQVVERVFDDGWQQAGGGLARDVLGEAQLGAALVDIRQLYPTLLGEAQGGLGRVAFSIEGGLAWRAVEVDAAVRLLGVEVADQHGQAARRGEHLLVGVVQASGLQAFLDTGEEGVTEAAQGLGWQFFGAQFNQEILSTHCAASSLANASSRNSGDAIGKPSLARACR